MSSNYGSGGSRDETDSGQDVRVVVVILLPVTNTGLLPDTNKEGYFKVDQPDPNKPMCLMFQKGTSYPVDLKDQNVFVIRKVSFVNNLWGYTIELASNDTNVSDRKFAMCHKSPEPTQVTFEKITMAGQNGKNHIWNIITIPNATTSTARKWCHIRSSSDGSDSSDIRYMVFAPGRHIVLDGKAGRSQQGSQKVVMYWSTFELLRAPI
ncbi:uncharacterized protein LOC135818064 [Sycon ciliatum]|uniref:uncharacterized protein LOC135818064 n=1 Tax=Sycon ciliatum TaxID=27933 RepID=UPI0031F68B66